MFNEVQGYFEYDNTDTIGIFQIRSLSFDYYTYPRAVGISYYIQAVNTPSKYWRLYYRFNGGSWTYVRNYYASNPYFSDNAYLAYDQVNEYNTLEVKISDPDNSEVIAAYGKMEFSSDSLKEKEIFVGEYDYTQYFEDLVSSSESQTSLITNIKNNVQSITEKVVSNHAMFFVLFLLALTVLVERALKGVIK